jgi:tRNA threonylcarbamoyladenosine modification (KEOPS) complex Cgi121 subunit
MTVVNAKFVASLMHLHVGISNAIIRQRDGKMKTKNLGNEITFSMGQEYSIQQCMDKFGVKNCQQAFFMIFVNVPNTEICKVKDQVRKLLGEDSELPNLNHHIQF